MTSLFRPIVHAWRSSATSLKMISFAVVGLVNTAIDFGVFSFAYKVLQLPIVAANVIAWLVAVSFSYVTNTLTTFKAETGRVLRRRDYLAFVASGVVGVIATTSTLVVLSHYASVMIAKVISIFVGFTVNFAMSNFVVFRAKTPRSPK
jgi:putative flippase GtrA